MLLAVQLAQLLERGDTGVLRDSGVRAAQEHAASAVRDLFELSARLEVAFRPEIFADFAALLHGCKGANRGRTGQVLDPAGEKWHRVESRKDGLAGLLATRSTRDRHCAMR
jgi:hypothetical protein